MAPNKSPHPPIPLLAGLIVIGGLVIAIALAMTRTDLLPLRTGDWQGLSIHGVTRRGAAVVGTLHNAAERRFRRVTIAATAPIGVTVTARGKVTLRDVKPGEQRSFRIHMTESEHVGAGTFRVAVTEAE